MVERCHVPPENLELHGRALHAGDAQRHPPVVDLIVAIVLQQGVGDLREAEALLGIDPQRHNGHAIQPHCAHL